MQTFPIMHLVHFPQLQVGILGRPEVCQERNRLFQWEVCPFNRRPCLLLPQWTQSKCKSGSHTSSNGDLKLCIRSLSHDLSLLPQNEAMVCERCAVCQDEIISDKMLLECSHVFHSKVMQ